MYYDNITNIGHTAAYSLAKGTDWAKMIFGYKEGLKNAASNINEFIKKLNFNKNLLVGIVPKENK